MLTFLSDAWIEALDAAAGADAALAEATAGLALTIEQCVTDGAGGEVVYHVAFDHGAVSVVRGAATEPTIRFSVDRATAAEIAFGTGSAQRAFMTGRLRVGGDLRELVAHGDLLGRLDDVFGGVRARTEVPDA